MKELELAVRAGWSGKPFVREVGGRRIGVRFHPDSPECIATVSVRVGRATCTIWAGEQIAEGRFAANIHQVGEGEELAQARLEAERLWYSRAEGFVDTKVGEPQQIILKGEDGRLMMP